MTAKDDIKDTFEELLAINSEADTLLEAKKKREEALRRSCPKDVLAWDPTGEKGRVVILSDWDGVLAVAVWNGW